jgi:hypothetical protein
MNVEYGHEYRDLQAVLAMEIFLLFSRFYHYYSAIAWSHYQSRVINLNLAKRIAKKVGKEYQQECRQNKVDGKNPCGPMDIGKNIASKNNQQDDSEYQSSFFVNT